MLEPGVQPPKPPSSTSNPASSKTLSFIARRTRFGLNNLDGSANAAAYKDIGFDIDGFQTNSSALTSKSVPQCQPPPSGTTFFLTDGNEGRDNTFGSSIYPQISKLAGGGGLENKLAADIAKGTAPTILLRLSDVNDGPDDQEVFAFEFYSSVDSPAIPKNFDGNDTVLVAPNSVTGNSIQNPLVALSGYMTNHTFVSASIGSPPQNQLFFIPLGPDPLLYQFVWSSLVIELDEAHTNAKKATFVGLILPKDLGDGLNKLIDGYYCNAGFLYTFAKGEIDTLPKYADQSSSAAPTYQDPSKVCDMISFAIEFDLVPVSFSEVDPDPNFVPAPCTGGAGGSGGSAGGL